MLSYIKSLKNYKDNQKLLKHMAGRLTRFLLSLVLISEPLRELSLQRRLRAQMASVCDLLQLGNVSRLLFVPFTDWLTDWLTGWLTDGLHMFPVSEEKSYIVVWKWYLVHLCECAHACWCVSTGVWYSMCVCVCVCGWDHMLTLCSVICALLVRCLYSSRSC